MNNYSDDLPFYTRGNRGQRGDLARERWSELSNLGGCTVEPTILQDPALSRYLKILVYGFIEEY